jgi:hypothetical protein
MYTFQNQLDDWGAEPGDESPGVQPAHGGHRQLRRWPSRAEPESCAAAAKVAVKPVVNGILGNVEIMDRGLA